MKNVEYLCIPRLAASASCLSNLLIEISSINVKGKNMKRTLISGLIIFQNLLFNIELSADPEAFEVGPETQDQLPGGKEADGIIGDFIMRNNLIEAVIAHNAHLRKANMATNWEGVTPGCLYDLTLRGSNNDQITVFAPSMQKGPVSYVRIVNDGSEGKAVVETVVSATINDGLFKRHEYYLQDDWQGLYVITTLQNKSQNPITIETKDFITNIPPKTVTLSDLKTVRGITVGDSIDPRHKAGYACGWVEQEGMTAPPNTVEIAPNGEISYARFIMVGNSPAQAFGLVAERQGSVGLVKGALKEKEGNPALLARVDVKIDEETVTAYPDSEGHYSFNLPEGKYNLTVRDHGRPPIEKKISVRAGKTIKENFVLKPASAIQFSIRSEDGKSIPCKAQFIGIEGTPSPNLGPSNRAHGCLDQYHSESGDFRVQLSAGTYRVIVTHGIEYTHLEKVVSIEEGETMPFAGTLARIVNTVGWISADYHNHSSLSGDNTTGTDDRIINLAAEQIEFAPTTEHNRLYDWRPHIEKLGLVEEINTISGVELTGRGAHFNAFPIKPVPHTQDGGAPVWQTDPRINAIVLRNFQGFMLERWVHLNHPDMVEDFNDRNEDGHADGGYQGLQNLIDAAETWVGDTNTYDIFTRAPFHIGKGDEGEEEVHYDRQFIWLQLLNRGHRYWSIAVSDAHSIHGNGVGGWRIYVPSSTDEPSELNWKELIRNSKAGQILMTNGPFLQVETEDGVIAGGTTRAMGSINLKVKVQTTDWIDIDRIQILVNSRQRSDLNYTRESHPQMFQEGVVKFNQTLQVPISEDSHLIVVAYGENSDLKTGYGSSWQAEMHPCAYINPIFVDADGGGFTPNGDTLDFPIPTKGLSVDAAKEILKRL